jgi:hypothetical protein
MSYHTMATGQLLGAANQDLEICPRAQHAVDPSKSTRVRICGTGSSASAEFLCTRGEATDEMERGES